MGKKKHIYDHEKRISSPAGWVISIMNV